MMPFNRLRAARRRRPARRRGLPDAYRNADEPDGHGTGRYAFGDYWKLELPLLLRLF
jgi:hypothetical protein